MELRRAVRLLVTLLALGCEPPGGGSSDEPLRFEAEQAFLPGLDYASGWIPDASPVQVQANVVAGGGISVRESARASDAELVAEPGTGEVSIEGRLTMEILANIDLTGVSYTGPVETFEYAIGPSAATFDPFAIDAAVPLETALPAQELGTVPVPSVPGATLTVSVTGGIVRTAYQGACAEVRDGIAQVTGTLTTSGTVELAATVDVEVPFVGSMAFGPFELSLDLPEEASPIDLGARSVGTGEVVMGGGPCSGSTPPPPSDGGVSMPPPSDGGVSMPPSDGGMPMMGCTSGQLSCDGACYPSSFRCDGHPDCSDGSDEGSAAGCPPPDTCDGCEDVDGVCQPGTVPEACGLGGLCSICAPGSLCVDGGCVAPSDLGSCADGTCRGCCRGGTCMAGNTASACRPADGADCDVCASPIAACLPDGGCGPSFTDDEWRLYILEAIVDATDASDASWDSLGGLPDLYVTYNGFYPGLSPISGATPTVNNSLHATWTAPEITAEAGLFRYLVVDLWDDDVLGDDAIGRCTAAIDWTGAVAECGRIRNTSGGQVGFTIRYRVEPAL
ncbi:MAG: low-density lipoprotein receptor class A repeat-containing protein [Sandaracinaceae bacterium]